MANKEIFLNSGAHKADLPKGTFDKSFRNHLTAKLGYLYPCLVEEAVAGSTYKIRPDMVFDLMPMAMPLQCRMRAHVSIFNVPFRIVMKSYKDYFSRVGDHAMPYIARTEDWVTPGSLADYMGVPTAQFEDASGSTRSSWVFRGRCTPAGFTIGDIQQPLSNVLADYYTLDTIVQANGTHCAYYSDSLEYPFSSPNLDFQVLGVGGMTNPTLFIYALVGNDANGYTIMRLNGAGSNYAFSPSSASPNPVGTYRISTTTITTVESSSVRLHNFHVEFEPDDIFALNSLISSGKSIRLMLALPNTIISFGVGFGSDFGDIDELLSLIRVVSSFDKDELAEESIVPAVSLTVVSSLLRNFSYSALIGGVENSRKYFNVVDGEPPKLPINALAFRAYEFIYNKYFRNLQIDKFYKNGEPSYNEYITNDGDGADSTTPVDLKRVPYEYDVFTTALPSPQMGYAPLVGVTTNDATGIGLLHMIPLVDGEPDPSQAYDIGVAYNSVNGDITGISNYDEVANHTSVARLREAIDFGISINDLRNVSAFQRLKEKMMKAGYEYQPLMEEFYGTTPPIGEEFPEYLGGFTREIQIGKIQNTALTKDSPLGMFAGVGGVAGSSRTIKVYTKEPSYIIGVLWFSVTPTYSQMLPKHFLKFHPLDYFNPSFNAIGPQPIHTHEIAPLQLTSEELNTVFGYQRPWYDYVSRVDECHGEFRTSMRHYLLQRLFAAAPELTANFVNIHSEELTDVFTYTVDSDKFFGYIDFDIKCKSPVARVSVPRIIG